MIPYSTSHRNRGSRGKTENHFCNFAIKDVTQLNKGVNNSGFFLVCSHYLGVALPTWARPFLSALGKSAFLGIAQVLGVELTSAARFLDEGPFVHGAFWCLL